MGLTYDQVPVEQVCHFGAPPAQSQVFAGVATCSNHGPPEDWQSIARACSTSCLAERSIMFTAAGSLYKIMDVHYRVRLFVTSTSQGLSFKFRIFLYRWWTAKIVLCLWANVKARGKPLSWRHYHARFAFKVSASSIWFAWGPVWLDFFPKRILFD